jgi:integrase
LGRLFGGLIVAVATRSRVALTHRFLETAKPDAAAYRVPDARCPGLAIRVAPSGVITYDLAFRIAKSKTFKRVSLGKFPDVSLDAARGRANDLTRAARLGRDLLSEETQAKAAEAARVSVDQLIAEYAKRRLVGRLRTAHEIEGRLRRALAPILARPADEIRRRDIRRLLDRAADAGHPREAEQRRVCLNGLFKWALNQDFISENPMQGLSSFGRSPPRERTLTIDELRSLWEWLDAGGLPSDAADVLRLQLCLGARCSEVGGMMVEEIDTATWLWTLPASRSKNKKARLTPIVGTARDIVRRRLQATKAGAIFVTATGQPLTSMHLGHFLLDNPYPIEKFGTHDLRRSVATQMAEGLGISLETIARVIGHTAGGASTRTLVTHYVSAEFIEQKTTALLAWDARLRGIIAGSIQQAANVVALVEARRRAG